MHTAIYDSLKQQQKNAHHQLLFSRRTRKSKLHRELLRKNVSTFIFYYDLECVNVFAKINSLCFISEHWKKSASNDILLQWIPQCERKKKRKSSMKHEEDGKWRILCARWEVSGIQLSKFFASHPVPPWQWTSLSCMHLQAWKLKKKKERRNFHVHDPSHHSRARVKFTCMRRKALWGKKPKVITSSCWLFLSIVPYCGRIFFNCKFVRLLFLSLFFYSSLEFRAFLAGCAV